MWILWQFCWISDSNWWLCCLIHWASTIAEEPPYQQVNRCNFHGDVLVNRWNAKHIKSGPWIFVGYGVCTILRDDSVKFSLVLLHAVDLVSKDEANIASSLALFLADNDMATKWWSRMTWDKTIQFENKIISSKLTLGLELWTKPLFFTFCNNHLMIINIRCWW